MFAVDLAVVTCLNTRTNMLVHARTYTGLLFDALDTDESGDISPEEIIVGLRKLPVHPRITCTHEDWNYYTQEGQLCSLDGTLDRPRFEMVIRQQLRNYVSRNIALTGSMPINSSSMAVVLAGM